MKDIPYNGDLSKDIYYLDNPFNLISLLIYIAGCLGVNTLYTIIDITKKKRNMKLKLAKANSNINSLVESLDRNNISISKEKIIDAEISEKVTNSKTKDDNGIVL